MPLFNQCAKYCSSNSSIYLTFMCFNLYHIWRYLWCIDTFVWKIVFHSKWPNVSSRFDDTLRTGANYCYVLCDIRRMLFLHGTNRIWGAICRTANQLSNVLIFSLLLLCGYHAYTIVCCNTKKRRVYVLLKRFKIVTYWSNKKLLNLDLC